MTKQKCFAIIVWQSRKPIAHRDVAQLVARMVWDHDAVGSNPIISTKKRQAKACRFFIHCENDGISSHFGVYIITIGVYHQPQVASSFAMMIYIFYEIGDIQNFVLMICNGSAIDFSVRLAISDTPRSRA